MKVTVITLFPEMFSAITENGITSRAIKQGLLTIDFINPREHSSDKHQTVDDRPYGGGPGMVMRVEPLALSVEAALAKWGCDRVDAHVIYMSPQGAKFDRLAGTTWLKKEHVILICGRYEGLDERICHDLIDHEISIGDYVLSGGELAAMIIVDAVTRLIPGVLGGQDAAANDSFSNGLLEHAHYTRPRKFEGQEVPGVLISGHHQEIKRWRRESSLMRTLLKRPDLLRQKKIKPGRSRNSGKVAPRDK